MSKLLSPGPDPMTQAIMMQQMAQQQQVASEPPEPDPMPPEPDDSEIQRELRQKANMFARAHGMRSTLLTRGQGDARETLGS